VTAYEEFLLKQIEEDTETVQGLVRHFPADRWDWAPGELWTARQHLIHLRNTEDRFLDRLRGVLAHGEYAPSSGPQPAPRESAEEPGSIVAEYAALRAQEVETFHSLTAAQWSHTFDHPTAWGRVSVAFWADRVFGHTADHIQGLIWLRQLSEIEPERAERFAALTGIG
jgi:hypothetical protein